MSSRAKRKFDIDPNASDPDDHDFDEREHRAAPPRRRARPTSRSGKKAPKRPRRAYRGSDVDEDDEILSDDSFTSRSASEDIEVNPVTGRTVRRAAQKGVKYEESDPDEIPDTASEDELAPQPRNRRRTVVATKEEAKPSLIVVLKMNKRSLRTRTGSKSIVRGKTPEAAGTRRSSRLSHDVEAPLVTLSDSGKHVEIVRQGTRSPEPMIARATRGGKGPRAPQHSIIMEASQEASVLHEDSPPGPLDELLGGGETQVQASHEGSPEHDAQARKDDDADEDMEGVIQESQQDAVGEDESDDEDMPITRGGRNLRASTTYIIQIEEDANNHSHEKSRPSENVVSKKAATSNQSPKRKKKRNNPNQTTARASSLHRKIAAQDPVEDQRVCNERHDSPNGVGAIRTRTQIPLWTKTS
jgi:hypothetical protein